MVREASCIVGIRGARASASLKRLDWEDVGASGYQRIRGARASASLKLGIFNHLRPADIEASEARAPRPH